MNFQSDNAVFQTATEYLYKHFTVAVKVFCGCGVYRKQYKADTEVSDKLT